MTWLVSIAETGDPGSPYYTVATDRQSEVTALEVLGHSKGYDVTVRHADSYTNALKWLVAADS
jgi:hypothetical protein